MAARILNLQEMTSEEVKALDRKTTCVLLVVSPVEEHGPHLDGQVRAALRRVLYSPRAHT